MNSEDASDRYDSRFAESRAACAPVLQRAARSARADVDPTSRSGTIVSVSAGVAAPLIVSYVSWLLGETQDSDNKRLCFMARDGQVMFEVANQLKERLGYTDIDLRYVHGSRATIDYAAMDPGRMADSRWLFASFMKPSISDLCERLRINPLDFGEQMDACNVDPLLRAEPGSPQLEAMRNFVANPDVVRAVRPQIEGARQRLLAYIQQEGIADPGTVLVDAGWSGKSMGALQSILDDADLLEMPPVRLIGFQPEQVGDGPRDVTAYFYDLRNDEPNVKRQAMIPPAVEMFCAGRHGITLDFEEQDGEIAAKLASDDNPAVDAWGLDIHRKAIRSFVDALTLEDAAHLSREASSSDVRVLLMELIEDFWVTPTVAEAQIWGEYPFDSDPRGSAIRRLAGPVTFEQAEGWKESGVLGEHYLWWQACARLSSGEAAQLLRETAEVLRDPVMRSMLPPLTSPP